MKKYIGLCSLLGILGLYVLGLGIYIGDWERIVVGVVVVCMAVFVYWMLRALKQLGEELDKKAGSLECKNKG